MWQALALSPVVKYQPTPWSQGSLGPGSYRLVPLPPAAWSPNPSVCTLPPVHSLLHLLYQLSQEQGRRHKYSSGPRCWGVFLQSQHLGDKAEGSVQGQSGLQNEFKASWGLMILGTRRLSSSPQTEKSRQKWSVASTDRESVDKGEPSLH